MPRIDLDGTVVEYHVRHSNRATRARIDAGPDEITVVIPAPMDLDPEELLRDKRSWVLDKKQKYDEYREKIPERNFEEGESFPYLGVDREITLERTRRSHVNGNNIVLAQHHVDQSGIKQQLENLYRRKAKEKVQTIINAYIDRIDGDHEKLYIRDQKTRWGSCSGKNNLSFNWRLLMAPTEVLEYVVVHELVHLEHRNHSDAFWTRLEELLPDYEEPMTWLKENRHRLVFDKAEFM